MDIVPLHLLTDALLFTLGRHSRQEYLRAMLRDCGMVAPGLLRAEQRPYPVVWPEHGLTVVMQPIETSEPPVRPEQTPDVAPAPTPEEAALAAAVEAYLGPLQGERYRPAQDNPQANAADGKALAPDEEVPGDEVVPDGYSWGLQSITFEAARWPGAWPGDLNPQTVTLDELVQALPGSHNRLEVLRTPEVVCLTTHGPDGQPWAVVALFDRAGKLQTMTFSRHGDWVALSILPFWPKANSASPMA